jgi:hypothetical protein
MDKTTALRKIEELKCPGVSPEATQTLPTQSEAIAWQLLCLDEESGRALVISTRPVALMPFDTDGSNFWQSKFTPGLAKWRVLCEPAR